MAAEAEGARVMRAETGKGTGRKTGGSKVNLGGASFWRWRRGRWFRWGWMNPLLRMVSGGWVSTSISLLGWLGLGLDEGDEAAQV